MPDFLRTGFAILPLGCYLIVLGLLRFRKHPTILSRGFDLLLLGLGCVGLISVGPIELFFPRAAYAMLGNWVWLVLFGLYALILLLIAFNAPIGFIAYGMNRERLKSLLSELLQEENVEHQWQGDCLHIPEWSIQGFVADAGRGDIASMMAIGNQQDVMQWVRLEQAVAKRAEYIPTLKLKNGEKLLSGGSLIFGIAFVCFYFQLERLREALAWIFE